MSEEILTKEDYINNHNYLSFTRFSKFLSCEAAAAVNYRPESTTSMLVGSYVDAYFSGEMDEFKEKNPSIFNKNGTLKADFLQADEIIKRIESDETMMYYMSGEKQKIMTGVIGGRKFKAKMDSYKAGCFITDLKVMKDFQAVWVGREKMNFVEAYNYDIELAIFQEIVFQNTGEKLPCYLCAITKEKPSDVAIFQIPQEKLDYALKLVLSHINRIGDILDGKVAPHRCETCEYCRLTKKARLFDYQFAGMSGDQLREEGFMADDPLLKKEE
ncbi:MAG: PD-(D/E)XK nuclease-like domain-containing protein [Bacilli bacterium]|nr:PD-(D/E)XK nuclease-like domain-containing protein [Bacilli bacterium]